MENSIQRALKLLEPIPQEYRHEAFTLILNHLFLVERKKLYSPSIKTLDFRIDKCYIEESKLF